MEKSRYMGCYFLTTFLKRYMSYLFVKFFLSIIFIFGLLWFSLLHIFVSLELSIDKENFWWLREVILGCNALHSFHWHNNGVGKLKPLGWKPVGGTVVQMPIYQRHWHYKDWFFSNTFHFIYDPRNWKYLEKLHLT